MYLRSVLALILLPMPLLEIAKIQLLDQSVRMRS